MQLSVDSAVIISVLKGESEGEKWLTLLLELRREHQLVICEVVYAELAALFSNEPELQKCLSELGLIFDSIRPETAFCAGQIFSEYRRAGGPRTNLIPDFLVGAHALKQSGGLLSPDRGYLRSHFRKLKVFQP